MEMQGQETLGTEETKAHPQSTGKAAEALQTEEISKERCRNGSRSGGNTEERSRIQAELSVTRSNISNDNK